MPANIYLPELLQCVAARAVDRHVGAFTPQLLNQTGHVRISYTSEIEPLVEAVDGAFAILIDRGANSIAIEIIVQGSEFAIHLSGNEEQHKGLTLALPGKIALHEPQLPIAGSPPLVGVKTRDASLLQYLEVLQPRLNFRCMLCDEEGQFGSAPEQPALQIIDARDGARASGPRFSDNTSSAPPTVLLRSMQYLESGDESAQRTLIWPFFDSDLLVVLKEFEKSRKLAVLVADDSAPSLLATRVMLELLGCDVTCAEDGNEALDTASSQEFDLIFLDERMPGLNGSEVAYRLSCGDSPNQETPKVSLTGETDPDEVENLYQQGITHYINKPVTKLVLENFLNGWRNGS